MSAFGTKRTYLVALHMSAFGGKADITSASQMSAYDPKRTCAVQKGKPWSPGRVSDQGLEGRCQLIRNSMIRPHDLLENGAVINVMRLR